MSLLRIELRKETKAIVNNNTNKIEEIKLDNGYNVYACCDEVDAYIGNCNNIEELEDIVSEDNLVESIEYSCSEYEMNVIMPTLECNDNKYDYFGRIRTVGKPSKTIIEY